MLSFLPHIILQNTPVNCWGTTSRLQQCFFHNFVKFWWYKEDESTNTWIYTSRSPTMVKRKKRQTIVNKIAHRKLNYWAMRNPLKNRSELQFFQRISISNHTSGTHRITDYQKLVARKEWYLTTTNGTYHWLSHLWHRHL